MKMTTCKTIAILFLFILITAAAPAQQKNLWTAKSARKWIKQGHWRNGMTIKVHPSTNNLEFDKQYQANKKYWDEAFAFMHDKDLPNLAPGKYVIDGDNVFATITITPSKTFEQSAWESHRKYIDLQYVISGEEKIGVCPLTDATVTKPYDETRDGANYDAQGKYYIATPDAFFLFFPTDVHRPNIKVDGFDVVKKLVIKIRYTPAP